MENAKINKYVFLGLNIFTIFISALFAFLYLSEWYHVKILKITRYYGFGESYNPFFYKTANIYSNVMLFFGLVYISLITFSLWSMYKKQRSKSLLVTSMTMLIIIIDFLIGNIKV